MRYGLVSDIHSNLAALDAVLEALDALGRVDQLLCIGDIIGYGPQPNEVIERLRERPVISIIGNHDLAVLGRIDLEDFNFEAVQANLWNREQLTGENRQWLESLEPMTRVNDNVTLAHGSPFEPVWEYLTRPQEATRCFEYFDTPLCFVGHTHLPRIFRLKPHPTENSGFPKISRLLKSNSSHDKTDMIAPEPGDQVELKEGRWILNPGSVGQPRDGDNRASFGIYDTEENLFTFGRAIYDIGLTQELMQEAGLPSRLILRLEYGL